MTTNPESVGKWTVSVRDELTTEQIRWCARAFVERRDDYIIIDSWSRPWKRDLVRQLVGAGLAKFNADASMRESNGEYTVRAFIPTEAFRTLLGATKAVAPYKSQDPSECEHCDGFGCCWNNADATSGQWDPCQVCGDMRGHP